MRGYGRGITLMVLRRPKADAADNANSQPGPNDVRG
jgi:hypothetical protein